MPKRKREESAEIKPHDMEDSSSDDEMVDDETLIGLETSKATNAVGKKGKGSKKKASDKKESKPAEEEDSDEEIVDVDFEFVDPKEIHFHSIKRLMKNYFPNHDKLDMSGLTNLIVGQAEVGTMIQINDDLDAYGFITLLPLDAYKESEPCLKELTDMFMSSNIKTGKEGKAILEKLFEAEGTGLLLHERMINLPPQVAVPLHDALRLDVEWILSSKEAAAAKKAQKLAPHFKNLKNLVLVAPCDVSMIAPEPTVTPKKSKKKKSKKRKVEKESFAVSTSEIYYHRFDDEVYAGLASDVICYQLPLSDADIAKGGKPRHRALIILPAEALSKGAETIKNFLSGMM